MYIHATLEDHKISSLTHNMEVSVVTVANYTNYYVGMTHVQNGILYIGYRGVTA